VKRFNLATVALAFIMGADLARLLDGERGPALIFFFATGATMLAIIFAFSYLETPPFRKPSRQ
jgi:hypothetical protein